MAVRRAGRPPAAGRAAPGARRAVAAPHRCVARAARPAGAAADATPTAVDTRTTPPQPAGASAIDPAPTTDAARDLFSWTAQWWPVAVEADLAREKPHASRLLGDRLVLWHDGAAWRAAADVCSHRLAPLSEGRVDGQGRIVCSYHGWAYGGDGVPASIPQAAHDSPRCEAAACASRRGAIATRPVMVDVGVVWVWGESGAGAAAAAARCGRGARGRARAARAPLPPSPAHATPPPLLPTNRSTPALRAALGDADPDARATLTTQQFYVRDFPVPFNIMVENLMDQSHVPFAHTNVASKRDSPRAAHFTVSRVGAAVAAEGADGVSFDLEWSPDAASPPVTQRVRFRPPCYVEYRTPAAPGAPDGDWRTLLFFLAVPLDGTTTRVFNHAWIVAPTLPPWVAALAAARPRWIDHLLLNEVFDGDLAYLAQASANFADATSAAGGSGRDEAAAAPSPGSTTPSSSSSAWAKAYFMPACADNSVVAWRRWLHGRGRAGPGVVVAARPPHGVPRAALFDRGASHTAHCPSCAGALRGAKRAATALRLAAAAGAAAGAAAAPDLASAVPALAAAAGAVAAAAALDAGAVRFVWKDYEHWKS